MSGYRMDVTLWGEHYLVEGKKLATLRFENDHPMLLICYDSYMLCNGYVRVFVLCNAT